MRPTDSSYRPDIDGLRAIAVLAVIAFHAFPGRVPGGFVGVDVFFVISGYLITGIIAGEASRGTFSYVRFYARRARRIFPALIVVLLTTMALGWFMLLPDEFGRLGLNATESALFGANFAFWHEAGYFDAASSTKALLHLWSLGVEEQFYLLWPVTVLAIWRLRHRTAVIAGIALVSFALNVATVRVHPSAAFYSPWTRIWELMIGALLAVHPLGERPRPTRDLMSLAGLVLIFGAIMRFSESLAFPGFYALAPTLGAALIIAAGADALPNRVLLARRSAVFIGLISYPLYLWHWPLLVFMWQLLGAYETPLPTSVSRFGVIALAFVAAYLTYRYLELPLRKSERLPTIALRIGFALALTACVGAAIVLNPVPQRHGDSGTTVAMEARGDWATPVSPDAPFYAMGSGAPEILFVGDSHAEQYFPAVRLAAGMIVPVPTVMFSTKGGCPFLAFVNEHACKAAYRRSLALASSASVRRVVIAGAWTWYADEDAARSPHDTSLMKRSLRELAREVAILREKGKDVVIITSHPNMPSGDPAYLAAPLHVPFVSRGRLAPTFGPFSLAEFKKTSAWIDDQLAGVAHETGARLISPGDYLCAGDVCPAMDERGAPLRIDADHFRPFATIRYFTYVPSLVAP